MATNEDWENEFKALDELQQWIRENQAKGSDGMFMEKVKEMKALMRKLYKFN